MKKLKYQKITGDLSINTNSMNSNSKYIILNKSKTTTKKKTKNQIKTKIKNQIRPKNLHIYILSFGFRFNFFNFF